MALAAGGALGAAVWAYNAGVWRIPAHWDPRAPLATGHPMTPVTRWKLRRATADAERCLRTLEGLAPRDMDWRAWPEPLVRDVCRVDNVVQVKHTGLQLNRPFNMYCPMLVTWLMFEQGALQPRALEHLGATVAGMEHYGGFACRNIGNRPHGRRSQHARAAALDVAAFRLSTGDLIRVDSDWGSASATSAFLKQVRDDACAYFSAVLGPEYDAAHGNHFHFDLGGARICR